MNNNLEVKIASSEQKIAETERAIRNVAFGDDKWIRLMDDLNQKQSYLTELQRKENLLLEKTIRETGK
jgi:flagellar biosynthesis regulator FlaF